MNCESIPSDPSGNFSNLEVSAPSGVPRYNLIFFLFSFFFLIR